MTNDSFNWEEMDKATDEEVIDRIQSVTAMAHIEMSAGKRDALSAFLAARSSRRLAEHTTSMISQTKEMKNLAQEMINESKTVTKYTRALYFLTAVLVILAGLDQYNKLCSKSNQPTTTNFKQSIHKSAATKPTK